MLSEFWVKPTCQIPLSQSRRSSHQRVRFPQSRGRAFAVRRVAHTQRPAPRDEKVAGMLNSGACQRTAIILPVVGIVEGGKMIPAGMMRLTARPALLHPRRIPSQRHRRSARVCRRGSIHCIQRESALATGERPEIFLKEPNSGEVTVGEMVGMPNRDRLSRGGVGRPRDQSDVGNNSRTPANKSQTARMATAVAGRSGNCRFEYPANFTVLLRVMRSKYRRGAHGSCASIDRRSAAERLTHAMHQRAVLIRDRRNNPWTKSSCNSYTDS